MAHSEQLEVRPSELRIELERALEQTLRLGIALPHQQAAVEVERQGIFRPLLRHPPVALEKRRKVERRGRAIAHRSARQKEVMRIREIHRPLESLVNEEILRISLDQLRERLENALLETEPHVVRVGQFEQRLSHFSRRLTGRRRLSGKRYHEDRGR